MQPETKIILSIVLKGQIIKPICYTSDAFDNATLRIYLYLGTQCASQVLQMRGELKRHTATVVYLEASTAVRKSNATITGVLTNDRNEEVCLLRCCTV